MATLRLTLTALTTIPLVQAGDDLAALIADAAAREGVAIGAGDVVIVAQKIVSKAQGVTVDLKEITPSERAWELAEASKKDARYVEAILRESRDVVAAKPNVLITEHLSGAILANAGVDRSNVDPASGAEPILVLPRDPDKVAADLRDALTGRLGVAVGVIINDSWGRPWRLGTIGSALGLAGLAPLHDHRGKRDLFGRALDHSIEAVGDELAAAANLVMGQADEGAPAVIVRGFVREGADGRACDLQRPRDEDMFR